MSVSRLVCTGLCALALVSASARLSAQAVSTARAEITRGQSVTTQPACLALHKTGLFSQGQCNGLWIYAMNADDKIFDFSVYYNDDLIGQKISTPFSLGQAIFRHSFGDGMANPVLKRYANEDGEKGLIDVANAIIYDFGSDIGDTMPDAKVSIKTVHYLALELKLIIYLKETDPNSTSPFHPLTQAQLDALKAGLMQVEESAPGPLLK
jgi:hypothetical protein